MAPKATMVSRNVKIGIAAVVIVVASGVVYAKHVASNAARDQMEGFIIRENLGNFIRYKDISASLFGTVTMTEVEFTAGDETALKVASLSISDIDFRDDRIYGASLMAKGLELPVKTFVRASPMTIQYAFQNTLEQTKGSSEPPLPLNLLALGYDRLIGDLRIELHADDKRSVTTLATSGEIRNAGRWSLETSINGIDSKAIGLLYAALPTDGREDLEAEREAEKAFGAIASRIAVASLTLDVDNSGLIERSKKITNDNYPTADKKPPHAPTKDQEVILVKAGLSPSKAKAAIDAFETWRKDGGRLRVTSTVGHPIPLFDGRNRLNPRPLYNDPWSFLGAMQADVAN